jgi:competence protein ComEC
MTPLIILTIAWTLGIVLARWLALPWEMLLLLAIPTLGGLFLYRKEPQPRFLALCALMTLLGAARLLAAEPVIDEAQVAFYNGGGPETVVARIIDEPDVRNRHINYHLRTESIRPVNGDSRAVSGSVLVQASRYPEYGYGDALALTGRLEIPPVFDTFSYQAYLARQGIHTMMRRPQITLLKAQSGYSLKAALYRLKTRAQGVINQILPEPQAALLNGILLGSRGGIPQDLYDQFNATGASHVIVISGSNITLVVAVLLLVGQQVVGRIQAVWLATLGVGLYTVLVGADAAVTRASIMGLILVGAIYFGRGNDAGNALFAAGLVMTIINPLTLWDVGFQLSFMATLGLIGLVPLLERGSDALFWGLPVQHQLQSLGGLLKDALLVTLAAQIIVTPLLIYHHERLSLVSLPVNLLIVPVQPAVMIFGGLATIAGLIYLPLGTLLGWLAWLPLAWTTLIVQWMAALPWAEVTIPRPPVWLILLMYATLGAAVWWRSQPVERRRVAARAGELKRATSLAMGGLLALALLTWSATVNLPDGRLHVAFLDVGQGDAIFITTPNGRQILIDGGPSTAQLGRRLGQEMPFWDRSIDLIINTHPDQDHLGGLVEILERYEVEAVFISDAVSSSPLHQAWITQLEGDNQQPVLAWQGMALALDEGVQALILNPGPASRYAESPNDHSVVIKLSMGESSFLLPGDIEAGVERALAASGFNLQATVLKSPHHGSKTSSDPHFLDEVNPQLVVISAGADNPFGHPHEAILQRYIGRGITTLRTDELGTIEFITNGRQVWVETRP